MKGANSTKKFVVSDMKLKFNHSTKKYIADFKIASHKYIN